MPIRIVELHHHAVPAGRTAEELSATREFYADLLGLENDAGRPDFGIEGNWYWVGAEARTQVHIVGVDKQPAADFAAPPNGLETHVAFAVEDMEEARRVLEEQGVAFVFLEGSRSVGVDQIFLRDPMGNMVELHEFGKCRCNRQSRPAE